MRIHRRQFLKYCLASAAALGLPLEVAGRLEQALAADSVPLPKVIWLNGANCTGCTVSLANLISDSGPADVADLLTGYLDLEFHPNLMAAAGDLAVQALHDTARGDFILAMDGGIPTAFNGHACTLWTDAEGRDITAREAVLSLAPKAKAILAIGTCASYGGMPAADPNPTGIVSLGALTGLPTINIPGCPTHPDWIVWTVANLLAGVMPRLDGRGRPTELYGREVHKYCPRKELDEVKGFGDGHGCLKSLGCKGPRTRSDCAMRRWNNKTNWCIGANAICLGCTEEGFPDRFSPFYTHEYRYRKYGNQDHQDEDSGREEDDHHEEKGRAAIRITKATWKREKRELRVEGKSRSRVTVTVTDGDTGGTLGTVRASSEGKWKFRTRNLGSAPGRIRASAGGSSRERAVKID